MDGLRRHKLLSCFVLVAMGGVAAAQSPPPTWFDTNPTSALPEPGAQQPLEGLPSISTPTPAVGHATRSVTATPAATFTAPPFDQGVPSFDQGAPRFEQGAVAPAMIETDIFQQPQSL